jgi:hypothetical protein
MASLYTHSKRAIVRACDVRLHRSFVLLPNPRIGRDNPIRVTYSDVGYSANMSGERQGTVEEEVPTLLWCKCPVQYAMMAFDFANHNKITMEKRINLFYLQTLGLVQRRFLCFFVLVSFFVISVKVADYRPGGLSRWGPIRWPLSVFSL